MSKKNEATTTVTAEVSTPDFKAVAADSTLNVSQRIRKLSELGLKRGDIVKALTEAGYKTKNGSPIRFQHVRNVLITPVKKAG